MENRAILVVDDNPEIINTIFTIISGTNQDLLFYQANNGKMGLKVACAKKPDLIITDWDMPEMDGIEFIKQLKAGKETNHIPVIMATGVMLNSEHLQSALAAGAIDYIRKPIDPVELAARVNSMLLLSDYIGNIRKQNEIIEQNNRFLSELINTIPYPVAHYDTTGQLLLYNRKFADAQNENNPISFYNCFFQDGKDVHIINDKRLIDGSESIITYEHIITFPDGSKRDIIFTKAAVTGVDSKPQSIICVMSDVTLLKLAHRRAIEQQKSDLVNISMKLIQTCELNEKIISDISRLSEHTGNKGSDLIKEIISNYRYAINENIWDEFEHRFNSVHSDFYNNLSVAHPDLTVNERKLCAFIKLNMSSKEIAAITFQNVKSIEMARYRLRKKLGMSEEDNLLAYISKY